MPVAVPHFSQNGIFIPSPSGSLNHRHCPRPKSVTDTLIVLVDDMKEIRYQEDEKTMVFETFHYNGGRGSVGMVIGGVFRWIREELWYHTILLVT